MPREDSQLLEKAIWSGLGPGTEVPGFLGALDGDLDRGQRSEPLAVTQLLLLYHLLEAAR